MVKKISTNDQNSASVLDSLDNAKRNSFFQKITNKDVPPAEDGDLHRGVIVTTEGK